MNDYTVWTASLKLDADYLITPTGKVLCILDLVSEGDCLLQVPCDIIGGRLCIASVAYTPCNKAGVTTLPIRTVEIMALSRGVVNCLELHHAVSGEMAEKIYSALSKAICG